MHPDREFTIVPEARAAEVKALPVRPRISPYVQALLDGHMVVLKSSPSGITSMAARRGFTARQRTTPEGTYVWFEKPLEAPMTKG